MGGLWFVSVSGLVFEYSVMIAPRFKEKGNYSEVCCWWCRSRGRIRLEIRPSQMICQKQSNEMKVNEGVDRS